MKMKKTIPFLGMAIASYLQLAPYTAYAYSGGDGSEQNPYLISSSEEFNQLRIEVNGGNTYESTYFKLSQDLDLKDFDDDGNPDNGNFIPIGTSSTPFKGHFDGGQHTISNMKIIQSSSNDKTALFAYASDGSIKNLVLKNPIIKNNYTVPSIQIAGLINVANNMLIENVGLLGGEISTYSQSYGTVGGLIHSMSNTTIKNSYVQSTLTANSIGGLTHSPYSSTIETSFFAGVTHGSGKYGISYSSNATVKNSYWDSTLSGITSTYGGGTPLTTEQFNTYTETQTLPGFDFDTIWTVESDSPYPVFKKTPTSTGGNSDDIQVVGTIQPLILSIDVPTTDLTFSLNPNQPSGQQFISPVFSFVNESTAPIEVSLKQFEQTTSVLNDVLPDAHDNWETLNKTQSQDIALALIPKAGRGWQTVENHPHYVVDSANSPLGIIRPESTVELEFDAYHGQAFSETLTPSYRLTFVFELKH